jgi:hypothetical protein
MADQNPPAPILPVLEQLANMMATVTNAIQQNTHNSEIIVTEMRNLRVGPNAVAQEAAAQDREDRRSLDFLNKCPTFERGKDRWSDFAARFEMQRTAYEIPERRAKEALWNAIKGKSSRIVVASMAPNIGDYRLMGFIDYLTAMGNKFTPASESMQMKTEYKSRVQGKQEDIQNYINEKYELFKLAYPTTTDMSDFYVETTKGITNKYVRTMMWGTRPASVTDYGDTAVFHVQVERQRIAHGDSDGTSLDGLIPVTKSFARNDRGEPMEIDALRRINEEGGEITEDEDECECLALHEQGFRGPCYYCRKTGHMLRNCPRKSAGLPRTANPAAPYKGGSKKLPSPQKKNAPWKPKSGYKKNFVKKRVNAIPAEEDEEEITEDEEEDETEEKEEVGFLGEETL